MFVYIYMSIIHANMLSISVNLVTAMMEYCSDFEIQPSSAQVYLDLG